MKNDIYFIVEISIIYTIKTEKSGSIFPQIIMKSEATVLPCHKIRY